MRSPRYSHPSTELLLPGLVPGQLTGHVERAALDPLGRLKWTTVLAKDPPKMLRTLSVPGATPSEIHLHGLLDSGAGITVLSHAAWPWEWPLDPVETFIVGVGGRMKCHVSQWPVLITNPDGQTAWEPFNLVMDSAYVADITQCGLIISTIACSHHLHTPMFFFLLNLALSDLGSICTTVPKAMNNSLWDTRNISYKGCAAQVFFFLFFITTEFSLLTVMCYDRYVSICKPLHYGTLLGSRACAHMAAAAWASGFLNALLLTANTFSLPLCHGNALGQFFCEIPQLLKLSCSHSKLRELWLTVLSAVLFFACFVFIVFSYVQIFWVVLRIPSEQGRHKAFSTCLPHLAVVSLFISTGTFSYLKPPSISSPSLDLALSVLYSVVPPALNPLIYSLRNQELKDALGKLVTATSEAINSLLCYTVFRI
ncbi:olfactory receptor 14A16-like [Melozone crissalis]|uniref:olfactory receptor 14A16-like n=1 Tax=Melozone crissalis TaxID=40204 RepID=UPI0023DC98A4|nr:olfactory receptor 14A16-like [Melozone crissalis]